MMETTTDSICRGELLLHQPRGGYRFNVDSLMLADFCYRQVRPPPTQLVDLGCGCGVIGLLLAARWRGCHATLVELQPELAQLARRNALENRLAARVEVRCADLREAVAPGDAAKLVVSNPPFYQLGSGRVSPNQQLALARHEVACTMEQLTGACEAALPQGGLAALIYPTERRRELLEACTSAGIGVELERPVQALPGREPHRLLLLGRKGGSGKHQMLRPLVVEQQPGVYTDELRRVLGGRP